MIVFVAVDPEGDLTPRAREALQRARVVITDPGVAALVARETPVEVHAPQGVDELLFHGRNGVAVRAIDARPLFSDASLAEISAVIEAPIEVEIIPVDHALPLAGRRVLVTRAREQSEGVARLLRRRGAVPIVAPTIAIGPPRDDSALRRAIEALADYDCVAFTSANGVERFFAALAHAKRDSRALHRASIAAIGPGTAAALATHGLIPDVLATEHRGEALADAILARGVRRVLLPRAAVARDVLPERLRAAGVVIDVVEAYRTETPSDLSSKRVRAIGLDAITFTSSSTVERFVEIFPDARALLAGVVVASIGPITSETARRLGLEVSVEASPYTIPALVDALERAFISR